MRVPRFLRARRLPRQREGLDCRHDDSESTEDRQSRRRHRGARHRSERRRQRPRHRRDVREGHARSIFQPASVVLLATYTYENVRTMLLSKSKAFPNGLANNHGPGRPALHDACDRRQRAGAVPREPEQLVRASRARRRGRRFRCRQLRSLEARFHRRRKSVRVFGSAADRRRQHEHVRQSAAVGIGVEGVHQAECRSRGTARTSRRRRCRTRTTISISIRP